MSKYINFHFEPSLPLGEIVIISIGDTEWIYDRSRFKTEPNLEVLGVVEPSSFPDDIEFKFPKNIESNS